MNMLDRLVGRLRRPTQATKPSLEPVSLYSSRPMTSFLDGLTTEQKTKLRSYRGQESHGEEIHPTAVP